MDDDPGMDVCDDIDGIDVVDAEDLEGNVLEAENFMTFDICLDEDNDQGMDLTIADEEEEEEEQELASVNKDTKKKIKGGAGVVIKKETAFGDYCVTIIDSAKPIIKVEPEFITNDDEQLGTTEEKQQTVATIVPKVEVDLKQESREDSLRETSYETEASASSIDPADAFSRTKERAKALALVFNAEHVKGKGLTDLKMSEILTDSDVKGDDGVVLPVTLAVALINKVSITAVSTRILQYFGWVLQFSGCCFVRI